MACHYVKHGTAPIVVGGHYTRSLLYTDLCKLVEHNEETHACTLVGRDRRFWMSEEELSNWHLVIRPSPV